MSSRGSNDRKKQTLVGHALCDLLDSLLEEFGANTHRNLIERINGKLPDRQQLAYQHVTMIANGQRKEPRPATLIEIVRGIGVAAGWADDRIQIESVKLLLVAGYDDIPGLINRRIDVAFQKLSTLMQAQAADVSEVDESDRLKIGVIEYEPFVAKGGDKGFAHEVAKLIVGSLLRGKNIGYCTWDIPLTYANMTDALEDHTVDLVVSGIVGTIPRAVRASLVELPALRIHLDGIAASGFEDRAEWLNPEVRIACREGEIGHEFADSFLNEATVICKPADWSTSRVLECVLNEEADVAIADSASCGLFHQKHKELKRVSATPDGFLHGYRIGFLARRSDSDWVSVLRGSVDQLCAGLVPLSNVYQKWVSRLGDFLIKPELAVNDTERLFAEHILGRKQESKSQQS